MNNLPESVTACACAGAGSNSSEHQQDTDERDTESERLAEHKRLVEQYCENTHWLDDVSGFVTCPGIRLHPTANGERDCKVYLKDSVTLSCFHDTCKEMVRARQREIRRAINKQDGITPNYELIYANRLAQLLTKRFGPHATCDKAWYCYRDGAWNSVSKFEYRPQAWQVLPETLRREKLANSILNDVETMWQKNVTAFRGAYAYDENRDVLLNVSNGVLVVKRNGERELRPHSSVYMFTKKFAAHYTPEATCPLFREILNQALPDGQDRTLFQFCAGNILLPDSRHECSLLSYGPTGSSKSTLAEAVSNALGTDNVTSKSLTAICDPKSYARPALRFAALNLANEVNALDAGDSEIFKAIVSGQRIPARQIYERDNDIVTTCKLWFCSNTIPRFKGGTGAEKRRIHFLSFSQQVSEDKKDTGLSSKLAAERDGIFNFMLHGLVDAMNSHVVPAAGVESKATRERFSVDNSPVETFVRECCVLEKDALVTKQDLSRAYDEWCKQNDLDYEKLSHWFFKALREKFVGLRDFRSHDGPRCYKGIKLKPTGPS